MSKLYLTCGDFILNSNNMDAIVNTQNKYMQYGSGICGAIYKAFGNELIEYCQNTYKEYMVNGEVRITPGFNLPMDIIHVLAPKYYEETDPINSHMDCYNNLLENDIVSKYNNFVKGLDLSELCLTQKLLCLQYTLYNFDLDRKQFDVLINEM